jgi:hypothetical protein
MLQARDNRALTDMLGQRQGQEDPPSITFREVQPFALWVGGKLVDEPPDSWQCWVMQLPFSQTHQPPDSKGAVALL